ncbi:TPA: hypothetical protein ACH3X2_008597 [Trebouxia sp. C0005]
MQKPLSQLYARLRQRCTQKLGHAWVELASPRIRHAAYNSRVAPDLVHTLAAATGRALQCMLVKTVLILAGHEHFCATCRVDKQRQKLFVLMSKGQNTCHKLKQ